MAQAYVPIQTVTLTGTTASITFSNIPQTYTDLKIVWSARNNLAAAFDNISLTFNGTSSGYTERLIYGNGSSVADANHTSRTDIQYLYQTSASATSSTFSNGELYITNYASSNNKSVSIDSVTENNATSSLTALTTGLLSNTAAITSIGMGGNNGSFVSGSTFTLYGIGGARASGGTITADSRYTYHTFTSSGTFTPLENIKGAEVLCIAGGGGGGRSGSGSQIGTGGGAGGLRSTKVNLYNSSVCVITIGAGSTGGQSGNSDSTIASNSTVSGFGIGTFSSTGGGGGVHWNTSGQNGGSGSGGGNGYSGGIGNLGGYSPAEGNNGASNNGGGGGASANASGANGGNGSSNYADWATATNTGVNGYYAGGGGAGGNTGSGGTGGLGGGGAGANGTGSGSNGTTNTGGGAGGNYNNAGVGGNGGSGLVIVRYPN